MNKILQNKLFRNIAKVVLLLLWLYVIYFFSSVPSLFANHQYWFELIIRKLGHSFLFGVLAFLLYKTLTLRISIFHWAVKTTFFLSLIYAFLDEWHQSFVRGRVPSLMDVGIDMLGVIVAIWLISLEHNHQVKNPKISHFIKI